MIFFSYDLYTKASHTLCFVVVSLHLQEVSLDTHRYRSCLQALRSRASTVKHKASSLSSTLAGGSNAAEEEIEISADTWQSLKLHVVSKNNFPTAAGLASSAAGFACLGECCCRWWNVCD